MVARANAFGVSVGLRVLGRLLYSSMSCWMAGWWPCRIDRLRSVARGPSGFVSGSDICSVVLTNDGLMILLRTCELNQLSMRDSGLGAALAGDRCLRRAMSD